MAAESKCNIPQPPSNPLSLTTFYHQWEVELRRDPDREFLLDGIKNGFRIVDAGSQLKPAEMGNYKSATDPEHRCKVEKQICEEIAEGNYIITDTRPTIISALGAIPKPNSGKVRLIHDCSQPASRAVNDYATLEKQSYQSLVG